MLLYAGRPSHCFEGSPSWLATSDLAAVPGSTGGAVNVHRGSQKLGLPEASRRCMGAIRSNPLRSSHLVYQVRDCLPRTAGQRCVEEHIGRLTTCGNDPQLSWLGVHLRRCRRKSMKQATSHAHGSEDIEEREAIFRGEWGEGGW
jgi:hypothetical protein